MQVQANRRSISIDQASRVLSRQPDPGTRQGDRVTLGGGSLASPALVPDGVCHASGRRLSCYDRNGQVRWREDFSTPVSAVGADAQGRTFVCSDDGHLHGLGPDGQQLFAPIQVDADSGHAPAVAPDGTVYIVTRGTRLEAYTPEGEQKFSKDLRKTSLRSLLGLENRHQYSSTPTLTSDGKAVVADERNYVTAFDSSGKRSWTYRLPQQVMTGISAGPDGRVGLGIYLDEMIVLNHKGKVETRVDAQGPCVSTGVAVAANGDLVAGDSSGILAAYDRKGIRKWTIRNDHKFTGTPTFQKGHLYATTWFGKFYDIDAATGKVAFSTDLGGGQLSMSSPVVDEEGTAYISLVNGLVALRTQTKEVDSSLDPHEPVKPAALELQEDDGWLVVGDQQLSINY
ncbi:MAG: PQQ-binding-like beta-propeller repeat protein [Vulcanimicrobiota bacterium]